MRTCDGCGTRLGGRKYHGHVMGKLVLCGRSETQKTVLKTFRNEETGELETRRFLDRVETPECIGAST